MAVQNNLNLTENGIVAHDGDGALSGRTITGTADFIDVASGDGSGNPTLSIATNFEETGMHGWNGSFVEKAVTTVTSDGATITLSIEKSGGGDLIIVFSDGYYDYDTTPAQTVILTAGTDTVPQANYVYIPQSTKVLTVSTTDWPEDVEVARVAIVICPTAALTQTDGPYKHHQWTDDVKESSEQGHISDITYWIRSQQATWHEGIIQTYTITTNAGSADNVILETTLGEILQLHENDFPAFTGTPDVYIVNDFTTPYTKVTDLNALLTDSTGASMSGRYFSLVIWGVSNQSTGDCKLFVNLPSGSYSNASSVTDDPSRYANFTIPIAYRGTGFLISQWNLRHQAASSGTWTSIDEVDLRGFLPNLSAGGTNSFPSEFVDTAFRVYDDGDNTKKVALQCTGITSGTTRTLTVQDFNGVIATTDVAGSGTGRASAVAYSVICGGTTSTAAHQSVVSVGTAGQALLSNGAGVLPTFQDVPGAGGTTWLATATAPGGAGVASLEFTSLIDSIYNVYMFVLNDLTTDLDGDSIAIQTSNDGGMTYASASGSYAVARSSSTTVNATLISTGATAGTDTGESISGTVSLLTPSDSSSNTHLDGKLSGIYNGSYGFAVFVAERRQQDVVDAIKFYWQTGNVISGNIKMYGMTKPS